MFCVKSFIRKSKDMGFKMIQYNDDDDDDNVSLHAILDT